MCNDIVFARKRTVLAAMALAVLLLVLIASATPASAGEPQPLETDPGQCALCHQAEVHDWQSSPHAAATMAIESDVIACEDGQDCSCLTCHTTNFSPATGTFEHAGVTCEACHGPLVEGHPENGHMILSVDSAGLQRLSRGDLRRLEDHPARRGWRSVHRLPSLSYAEPASGRPGAVPLVPPRPSAGRRAFGAFAHRTRLRHLPYLSRQFAARRRRAVGANPSVRCCY